MHSLDFSPIQAKRSISYAWVPGNPLPLCQGQSQKSLTHGDLRKFPRAVKISSSTQEARVQSKVHYWKIYSTVRFKNMYPSPDRQIHHTQSSIQKKNLKSLGYFSKSQILKPTTLCKPDDLCPSDSYREVIFNQSSVFFPLTCPEPNSLLYFKKNQ